MVDPKRVSADPEEVNKGGFGAFAAKDWARRAARAEAEQVGKSVASNPEPAADVARTNGASTDPRVRRAEKVVERAPNAGGSEPNKQ